MKSPKGRLIRTRRETKTDYCLPWSGLCGYRLPSYPLILTGNNLTELTAPGTIVYFGQSVVQDALTFLWCLNFSPPPKEVENAACAYLQCVQGSIRWNCDTTSVKSHTCGLCQIRQPVTFVDFRNKFICRSKIWFLTLARIYNGRWNHLLKINVDNFTFYVFFFILQLTDTFGRACTLTTERIYIYIYRTFL